VVEDFDVSEGYSRSIEDLKIQFAQRKVWMASSIHRGEEESQFSLVCFQYYTYSRLLSF
jgi:3-deoxy-D-manno-octulosonic-acid transferase